MDTQYLSIAIAGDLTGDAIRTPEVPLMTSGTPAAQA
jgi:hypothetical protein